MFPAHAHCCQGRNNNSTFYKRPFAFGIPITTIM